MFQIFQMDQIQKHIKLWLNKRMLDLLKWIKMSIDLFITMSQEEMRLNIHLFHQLLMDQIQNHSKHWLKNPKKLKTSDQKKWTEMYTNSFTTMSQEEMSPIILLFHQLQMDQIQNHSKHWLKNPKKLKTSDQKKWMVMFINSFTTMSQEETSLIIHLFHQLQMDQIQNHSKL